MKFDLYIFQIAILFLPGVIWARLDASWTYRVKPTDTEFVVRSFLFGIASYLVTFALFYASGHEFEVVSLSDPKLTGRIAFEIGLTSLVGFSLGVVWIYAINRKIISTFLNKIGATRRYGDEDVWDYIFNSGRDCYRFANVRDFEQKLVYSGFVAIFSETDKAREIVLHDAEVWDFEGNLQYEVAQLYLSRKADSMHIEFPVRRKE